MNWQEVCEHPALQNLPFKIELNERGQIVMSPVKIIHSLYQGEIGHLLRTLTRSGRTMPECAIRTEKGTKVADVVWVSPERLRRIIHETECSVAPEICVEVVSGSNTDAEMAEKRRLYFESGAEEVWICTEEGNISFYNPEGQLNCSALVPEFPGTVSI